MIQIRNAADALAQGQLVAFPTETVYGLGADAKNAEAVRKVFEAKGRPANHPLIVHIAEFDQLAQWCRDIPEAAELLAKLFWPGPLTLVLKKAENVLPEVTGGQDSVAVRIPSHPVAIALLRKFGSGIVAPSANKFGRLSPTTAADVREEFADDELAMILDGGPCEVGIESTIVDLSRGAARILRPGMVLAESIFVALDNAPEMDLSDTPRVPGSLASHYAPRTPVRLASSADISQVIDEFESQGFETAVLSFKPPAMLHKHWIMAKKFPSHYAHTLYRNLRKLDGASADMIIVEEPPDDSDWDGIWDRLKRAAFDSKPKEKSGIADSELVHGDRE